ncbi:MAG TPA: serine hydrolase domain-containing protein [Kofleriaceae bacterium]|nr:serine hydrolase domain-containing protein [Kofleriaceae bacterium]
MSPRLLGLALAALTACITPLAHVPHAEYQVHGSFAPGFEDVWFEFRRNFVERGEAGAALAVYYRGEKVVDLWGGFRDAAHRIPWQRDTMVVVYSTTKGMAALALALAHARGWLDYDAPVARYWPEFAARGKQGITVRQLLAHQAGLVVLDDPLSVARMRDLDAVARVLAAQRPAWRPGTTHGYHASTIGMYMNELLRRVDPRHRSLGRFFHEEIAVPLGLDFYIGLPDDVPDARLAHVETLSALGGLGNLGKLPFGMAREVLWPWSLFNRSLAIPRGYDPNRRASLAIELPSGNGVGTARALARAYSELATGGHTLGLDAATLAALFAPPVDPPAGARDRVMGIPTWFSLGFWKPSPGLDFGSSRRAIGSSGAGGSFAYADPDRQLGYAYVMNRMDYYVHDPREVALRRAVVRCIDRLERAERRRGVTSRR